MMNTNTHTTMDINTVIQALAKKFGSEVVSTQDSQEFIKSLGQDPAKYYLDLRARFRVGHGKLCFANIVQSGYVVANNVPENVVIEESDWEIEKRLNARFNALNVMSKATARGINRALILSGPPGLGKSFGVERAAEELCPDFEQIKGYIRPTGLYKTLYKNRHKGSLVVFDDIDSLFSEETSLNLLKAACDSTDVRRLSWLSSAIMEDEDGEEIPSSFVYEGSIIFITNVDFQQQVDRGSKLSPHFDALMSRSHYLSLGIKNKRDYIIRIKQVLAAGMLSDVLSEQQKSEIVDFLEENSSRMRELSLRMVKKLSDLMQMDEKNWKELASITCMK
jgi:hypothetical protein